MPATPRPSTVQLTSESCALGVRLSPTPPIPASSARCGAAAICSLRQGRSGSEWAMGFRDAAVAHPLPLAVGEARPKPCACQLAPLPNPPPQVGEETRTLCPGGPAGDFALTVMSSKIANQVGTRSDASG